MAYPANSIIEVRIAYTANGRVCYNVLHYNPDNTGAGVDVDVLQTELATRVVAGAAIPGQILNEMLNLMSQDVTIVDVAAQCIWPTRYRASKVAAGVVGLRTEEVDAQNVAAVIQKWGDQANRHNIGRFHLGGLGITVYDNGMIDGPALALLGDLAVALGNEINVVGTANVAYLPVILNKGPIIVDGQPDYGIIGYTEVVGTEAKSTLRTMRRRTLRL